MKIELTQNCRGRFEPLRFVISARSKTTSQYAIQQVLIEENCIVATDGRRLHVAHYEQGHGFEPGLYDVIKSLKTKVILLKSDSTDHFPKWRDIVPHYNQYFTMSSPGHGRFVECILGVLGKVGVSLDYHYLLPFCETDSEWRVFYGDFDRAVRLTTFDRYSKIRLEAVIMPVTTGLSETNLTTKSHRRKYAVAS